MAAGLSEYEQMCLNIGSTLSQWQSVELALCDVFTKVSKSRDPHIASAIFYSIINFEAKFKMTNTAALLAIRKVRLRKEWIGLADKVRTNSLIRNKIVHFMITLPTAHPKAKYKVILTSNAFDTTHYVRSPDEGPPAYNYGQIAAFGIQFSRIYTEVTAFAAKL